MQKKAQTEIVETQAEIQAAERSRYEQKLKQMEESFAREVTTLKATEVHYQEKIAGLECKTNFVEKKNETIGELVSEIQTEKTEYENKVSFFI
jgi:chromosome segregation ATPase